MDIDIAGFVRSLGFSMSELANKVRALRDGIGQSQQVFAKTVGLSLRTITKIEAGIKPRRSNIIRLAEKLHLKPAERMEMLLLWLKSEVGYLDYEMINPQPILPSPKSKDREAPLARLLKLAPRLAAAQQEQLALACERPMVLASVATLNELHEQIHGKRRAAES
jgi:DNA-binding XRE family transcriptional regulator